MIQAGVIIFMITIAALIQEAALVNFFPAFAVPDVLLVIIALWTIHNGFEKTWPRAIFAGIALDLVYFWPIGINVIALSVVSYSVTFLAKRFLISQRAWKFLFLLILTVASTLLFHIIYNIISIALDLAGHFSPLGTPSIFSVSIVYKIMTNLLVLGFIYWPVKKVENFLSLFNQSVIGPKR